MRSTITQSVGVDISKDALDVAVHPAGESFRIPNDPQGHRALIKKLKGFDVARIVFEATGAYHRLFQHALDAAGLPARTKNGRWRASVARRHHPGCPFRPLGKERGGQTTGQSFQTVSYTHLTLPTNREV